MTTKADELPDDLAALKAMVLSGEAENAQLRQIIKELQRHRFGRRAETLPEDQLLLALEEAGQTEAAGTEEKEQISAAEHEKRVAKRRTNRGALPAHLPRIEITINTGDHVCPCCQNALHKIGEDVSRPTSRKLHRMLDQLREGDTVVVWKLDRLSRSLKDVLHIMERIAEAGAGFRSITENIDTTTPACRMMMQMAGSLAEFERAMIRERTSAGIAAARAILQVDGYGGYRPLAEKHGVALAFCWAHVRRRFYEVSIGGLAPIASEALRRIAGLYRIETEIRGQTPDKRCAIRRQKSRALPRTNDPL